MYPFLNTWKKARQRGFTLVEIMVAMVLAGILAIGMQSFFAMLGEEVQEFTLRQKAVFLLNGEMEKLYFLFQNPTNDVIGAGGFSTQTLDSGYAPTFPAHWRTGGSNHRILNATTIAGIVTNAEATFSQVDANGQPANEQLIFFYTPPAGDPRNVIWLDFEKRITARVSWVADEMPGDNCYQNGSANQNCLLITLYLDYPFRYQTTPTFNPLEPSMGRINTLVLRTIVGDWRK
ncbi:MAG: prepilin-type N-terminal cleavage/methylation domain-containing protein [Magnetococcales bacterium]|nr:prepilin-type N-terminal cleavage/methylation domain-containing protein [Magnetococcales bacterium]